MASGERLARGLGWFSIGLGLAEAVAGGRLSRSLGMEKRAGLVRVFGLREVASGVAILAQGNPAPGVWARVGGDALDLAALGFALPGAAGKQGRIGAALAAVAGITALDVVCAQQLGGAAGGAGAPARGIGATRTLTIGKPADELYHLWREPQTLPRVMAGTADVVATGAGQAQWRLSGPLGRALEWETRIVEERPGELVRWESMPGAAVRNEGSASFRPGPAGWGTEVTLRVRLDPPGGLLAAAAALLPGGAQRIAVAKALRRFQNLAETGEIPATEPQPAARADKS